MWQTTAMIELVVHPLIPNVVYNCYVYEQKNSSKAVKGKVVTRWSKVGSIMVKSLQGGPRWVQSW